MTRENAASNRTTWQSTRRGVAWRGAELLNPAWRAQGIQHFYLSDPVLFYTLPSLCNRKPVHHTSATTRHRFSHLFKEISFCSLVWIINIMMRTFDYVRQVVVSSDLFSLLQFSTEKSSWTRSSFWEHVPSNQSWVAKFWLKTINKRFES